MNEILVIKTYLSSMKFLSTLKFPIGNDKLLYSLSLYLKMEKKSKDEIIFRYGNKGTKFFIVLEGEISILILKQYQGSEQSYWNVGVNLSVPLEDVLDLGASVKRKRLEVENAQLKKDIAYDQLKLEIVTLYVRITNNLTALKTAGENAAAYQGAGALNEVEFHHGNMQIEDYAYTGLRGQGAVNTYQNLLTQITTDIVTLEILTHTPIITNTTTEITLGSTVEKTKKQIAKENKEVEKRIKKSLKEEEKAEKAYAKQEAKEVAGKKAANAEK